MRFAPFVRQPAGGRSVVLALAVGVAACSAPPSPPPPAPIAVTTVLATPTPAQLSVDYVAQTESPNTVEIRPRVGGLLDREAAVEGSRVHRGQLLFTIDPQPYEAELARARAALAEAKAALEQSQRDFARVKPLSAIDAVSQQELDAAIAKRDASRASVQAAQAALKTAQLNLGYTHVYSPIDGVLGRAQLKVGGVITAYQTLLSTVYATDPMYVDFAISEQRMLELQHQYGRPLSQDSKTPPVFRIYLADGSEYPYPGKLNFIDAAVNPKTGTLGVRLTLPNPQSLLRSNQFARVKIVSSTIPDALLVPQRAVMDLQGKNYLWLVGAGGKAEQRDVVMGPRLGENWLVQQGLKPGDQVIVDGVQKMRTGVTVKAEPLPPPRAEDADAGETPTASVKPGAATQAGGLL